MLVTNMLKKKWEREKIVYFNNTSYIFAKELVVRGITIEQSLVVSCRRVLSLSLNFKSACQCFSIQCTQCELQHLLNVWQDIHAHDITCWEDREATVGLASGRGSISAAIEDVHKVCDSQLCSLKETEPELWVELWHMLLMAWIAALEESILFYLTQNLRAQALWLRDRGRSGDGGTCHCSMPHCWNEKCGHP